MTTTHLNNAIKQAVRDALREVCGIDVETMEKAVMRHHYMPQKTYAIGLETMPHVTVRAIQIFNKLAGGPR